MIWDLDRIVAESWAETVRGSLTELPVPRSLNPVSHGSYALGRRPRLPLPREGIGGSVTRPT